MKLDIQTFRRLTPVSNTEKVMNRAKLNGRSHWAIRVNGQVIVVGDLPKAIALYDKARSYGATPVLLNSGRVRDRSTLS